MTGILRKALRGAATKGAELSMENYRANIQAKRDAKLQSFQTSERVAGEAHDIKLQKLQNEGRAGGGATQGDIQLMNYFQERGLASTPNEAYALAQKMNTDPSKVILDISKSLRESDDQYDRKPLDHYIKIAEGEVKGLNERLNPQKPKPGAPTNENTVGSKPKGIINSGMSVDSGGMIDQALDSALTATQRPDQSGSSNLSDTVKIQTEADYMKLPSGTRYIAPDGKVRVKK